MSEQMESILRRQRYHRDDLDVDGYDVSTKDMEFLLSELALLRRAARALVNDIRTCYPEGLGELGGIGPYVEAIEAELIKEQEGASLAEDR